ncbi:hypothetical protein B0H13DRAFT_1591207 [Mycena leptocephala]|nr:hypothetical protein B0H13DRAFT_1591207 [Mycena leptocephala]
MRVRGYYLQPNLLSRGSGDLDLAIAGDQDRHIRHEAIEVTEHQFPFGSEEVGVIFYDSFKVVQDTGIIPIGMGVAEGEWEDGFYAETEAVKVGRKDIEIPLPFRVWWPRAVTWAQGLEIMAKIQAVERGDIILP